MESENPNCRIRFSPNPCFDTCRTGVWLERISMRHPEGTIKGAKKR